jgi:hypothetical protein
VVLQVVFVLGDERALWAVEHLFGFYVLLGVSPKVLLGHGNKLALFTLENLYFTLKIKTTLTN